VLPEGGDFVGAGAANKGEDEIAAGSHDLGGGAAGKSSQPIHSVRSEDVRQCFSSKSTVCDIGLMLRNVYCLRSSSPRRSRLIVDVIRGRMRYVHRDVLTYAE